MEYEEDDFRELENYLGGGNRKLTKTVSQVLKKMND